jgi:hypothetical protein
MIMALPSVSSACAMVSLSPDTTIFFSRPNALHRNPIAAGASR